MASFRYRFCWKIEGLARIGFERVRETLNDVRHEQFLQIRGVFSLQQAQHKTANHVTGAGYGQKTCRNRRREILRDIQVIC